MRRLRVFGFLLFVSLYFNGLAQEVLNMRVSQTGNRVSILYDLTGDGIATKIDLYVSADEGVTWVGPLKFISGDINNVKAPAQNKMIIWDARSEKGNITGTLQFKFDMEFSKAIAQTHKVINPDLKRHKTMKNVWLTTALISTGTGILTLTKANSLYDDYQKAGEDAADIHGKIKTLDVVYPVSFGIAAISGVNFIIQANKQGKVKKQLSVNPMYLQDGGGATLTFKF